jgi:hypothetical protein
MQIIDDTVGREGSTFSDYTYNETFRILRRELPSIFIKDFGYDSVKPIILNILFTQQDSEIVLTIVVELCFQILDKEVSHDPYYLNYSPQ